MRTDDASRHLSDAEKAAHIRSEVLKANAELRERHPILLHQDALGASILTACILGMVSSAWLYWIGAIPWYVCIPVSAFFAGVTQEVEHDLIHMLYFRDRRGIYNLMMAAAWLARPNTVSPWFRRRVHLHHHRHSGTDTDFEEQILTNGVPWGFRRLLMCSDLMLSIMFRPVYMFRLMQRYVNAQRVHGEVESERRRLTHDHLTGFFPLGNLYHLLLACWVVLHLAQILHAHDWTGATAVSAASLRHGIEIADFLMVTWLAPNMLRIFSLNVVSSNMHYCGDVEPGNVMQQCQVLDTWWLTPLHLFCFNFGGTHAIHHFVVKETFYVRQLTARRAHAVMREMGVRFNDIGTFRRANRWDLGGGQSQLLQSTVGHVP